MSGLSGTNGGNTENVTSEEERDGVPKRTCSESRFTYRESKEHYKSLYTSNGQKNGSNPLNPACGEVLTVSLIHRFNNRLCTFILFNYT